MIISKGFKSILFSLFLKPMVLVKNFLTGNQWIWTKEKFLDRKEELSQYYSEVANNSVTNKVL